MSNIIKTLRSFLAIFPIIMTPLTAMSYANPTSSLIELIEEKKLSIVTIQNLRLPPDAENIPISTPNLPLQEKTGAGIIIDSTGYIVTNTHIILEADYIFVTLHDGTRVSATVATVAPDTDFSILKIDPPYPLTALQWSEVQNISLGTEVISIGNSALWRKTICAGKITGLANKISDNTVGLIEMDLDLDRGDSGGPVLDRNGHFLGIIIAKNVRSERSSYAIPSGDIRRYFFQYLKDTQH